VRVQLSPSRSPLNESPLKKISPQRNGSPGKASGPPLCRYSPSTFLPSRMGAIHHGGCKPTSVCPERNGCNSNARNQQRLASGLRPPRLLNRRTRLGHLGRTETLGHSRKRERSGLMALARTYAHGETTLKERHRRRLPHNSDAGLIGTSPSPGPGRCAWPCSATSSHRPRRCVWSGKRGAFPCSLPRAKPLTTVCFTHRGS